MISKKLPLPGIFAKQQIVMCFFITDSFEVEQEVYNELRANEAEMSSSFAKIWKKF